MTNLKSILAGTNFTRDAEFDFNQRERNEQALRKLEAEIANVAKAFGGCTNCYGKGYSTVIEYASGYDTDTDIGSPGGRISTRKPSMKFCSCDRGKQLERELSKLKARHAKEE